MILEHGDTAQLQTLPWYMLELHSEKSPEPTIRRICRSVPTIFRDDPLEVFIPILNRGLDTFELATGPYLFVRSTNFKSLARLKTGVTGVVGLVTAGGSNHASRAIPVDDAYVQNLIAETEARFRSWSESIEVGSFVRILNGDTRDYCGTVEALDDTLAIVR